MTGKPNTHHPSPVTHHPSPITHHPKAIAMEINNDYPVLKMPTGVAVSTNLTDSILYYHHTLIIPVSLAPPSTTL